MKKYIRASQSTDEKLIKRLFKDYILQPIKNNDFELYQTLRGIIFDSTNKINWDNAWDYMVAYVPALEDIAMDPLAVNHNIIYVDQLPEDKKTKIARILYRDGYSSEHIDELMNEKISDIRGISESIDAVLYS